MRKKEYKQKQGYYIEVTTKTSMFHGGKTTTRICCKDTKELRQRLHQYKGRSKVLGKWDGVKYNKISSRILNAK